MRKRKTGDGKENPATAVMIKRKGGEIEERGAVAAPVTTIKRKEGVIKEREGGVPAAVTMREQKHKRKVMHMITPGVIR